jgi:hypothetical protein
MTERQPFFPTPLHQEVAEAVVGFFKESAAEAVLLVNSCARGAATSQSDIDLAVLVRAGLPGAEKQALEQEWTRRYEGGRVFRQFGAVGRFSCVHLDLFDGQWEAERWDDGGGPDAFEIEIGNRVAHAVPLWERSAAFAALRSRWLPYYDEQLRAERLAMVADACRRDLERIAAGVRRGLHFYSFDRLYHAFQEFLQAVFIARRVYPIAYNKWIREQVEGWLGLPDLYAELPRLLQLQQLESDELLAKAEQLGRLLDVWVTADESTKPQGGLKRTSDFATGPAR